MQRQQMAAEIYDASDAGAPVNGSTGTGAGFAGIGSSYTNTLTGDFYINVGTKAIPLWQLSGGPALTGVNSGLASVGLAKMTYSFAVDGGAIGLIVPVNSPTLPNKAIIMGGVIDISTTVTGAGASISLGTSAGSSNVALLAATAIASWGAGAVLAMIPIFTAATYLKLTAAGKLTLTVSAGALTAGIFDVQVVYVIGN